MAFFEMLLFLGNTPGANLLTTIFGSTTNRYYESTGEYLYIRFTSDNAVEKSGFSLQYFSLFSTGKITFTLIILLTCTCIVNNVNLVGSEKNFPDFSKKKFIYTRKHIVYLILKTRFWSFNYEIIFRNKYIIILLYPSNIIHVIIVFQATRQTVFSASVIGQRQGLPCYALSNRHTITLTVTLSIQQTLSTFPDPYSGYIKTTYAYWRSLELKVKIPVFFYISSIPAF